MTEPTQKREISDESIIIDFTRIGHIDIPSMEIPQYILTNRGEPGMTLIDLFFLDELIDPAGQDPVQMIERIGDRFLGERGSLKSVVSYIDQIYLSEQSYSDRYTDALLASLQYRQGLSPLNVFVWRPITQQWEKVAPLDSEKD